MDELITRLRTRAADPERRTDARPSEFLAEVRGLDLGSLFSLGRQLTRDLSRVVQANREGRVDQAGYARALELERWMTTPAPTVLPAPADERHVARAERALGMMLPSALRRVYLDVADGGFGPGEGILPLDGVVRHYAELRSPGMMPEGQAWPEGLLPVVNRDPGWDCVDAATGRVVAWDPEELEEDSSEEEFSRSFSALFPTVEAWLADWAA